MTKLNPYTNKPTRFITKEEILAFGDNFNFTELEFHEIDSQVRCSFELGATKLVNQQNGFDFSYRASTFKDLTERIPKYGGNSGRKHEENFKFWVSELIQNAHDAVWKEEGRHVGPTKFEFEVGNDSFLFSHNGRPPQWIDFAQNEVEKMTKFSTSKHNQYATEGQFGIGFKIWIHMFDEIVLRYGHCELKISINRTGEYHYPEFSTTWYDEGEPKFRIRANKPRSNDVSSMLEELSENNLEEIFQRSIQGLLMRPNPFEMIVRTPNYQDKVAKTEEQTPSTQLQNDGFKSWKIDAAERHGLPSRVITFSQPIEALQYSDDRLSTILRKEIEDNQDVMNLYKSENPQFSIDEVVGNTLKLFDATITIIPDTGFEWAIYNSLFPIPGAFNENLTTTGVHFVAKFAMDPKRQNLAVSTVEKERNDILMMSLLECYFQMMDSLKHVGYRGELGIVDETYYRLIGVFRDNQENDDGINNFVNEISNLLKQSDYSQDMKKIFELFEIYPLLKDGAYSKYLNLKVLRPEVKLLLEQEEEQLQNWGESVLDPSEGICKRIDGAFEYYSWNFEAWDAALRSNEAVWELQSGPEGMDTETLLGHINRIGDFGCPDWLKIPMYRNTESGIEWFTLEELDGHLISRKSEEETVDLSDFEASVRSKLLELGVDELFIDSHWKALLKTENNEMHEDLDEKIVNSDTLYAERVRLLIENSDDEGRAFFLELTEQHPQTEATFPFFLTTEIEGKQEVVKLEEPIPESVLFREDTTSVVVKCEKSSSHWKILNSMDIVAMVLGRNRSLTHIFVDQEADNIIQDINNISILPHSTIAVENIPKNAEAFSGLTCSIPPLTGDDVRETVLSWVNKIPHVGVPLKLEPQHFFDVFGAQIPTKLRLGTGDNDRYIVVPEPTFKLKTKMGEQRKKNHFDDNTAKNLINTEYWKEGNLDKSADKKAYWTQAMTEGKFTLLLRVCSYPSVIAENLIEEPSKRNYLRYLRSLRFTHMEIHTHFMFLYLGDLDSPKSGQRRIRIVCKKFSAADLRALENANSIMTYLNQNKAYIGCLPESPTEELKKMFGVTPNYKSPSLRNTAAAQWNLVPGKLSSMVFRHALLHRTALLPDTILLKNAPYFEQNPVLAQQAVALLDRLDHQLMPANEFPLEERELFHHFFSDIPHKKTGKHMLLWELIESIVSMVENLNQKPNVLLAHSLEALVLSQHQFLNLIDETKHEPYWRDLAAIEFENYKSDDVTWSERFAQLLDRRKQFDANTIKFIDELNGLTDFSKVLNSLRKNGEKRSQRKCGTTLQKENLPITQQTKVYVVLEDKYDSCFPLTTKSAWLSEHSNIFSNSASIVLTATTAEWNSMEKKFPDELSQHKTAQRILNEVRTILQAFLEAHTNAGADGERNDAGDESQRRAVEFLRRGVLRYLADIHSPVESGIGTGDLLNWAYNSIDVQTVSVEQANAESMFPQSDDEFLSNMLIGPCGIGWSLDNSRLTMTLGPWLNRDWGGEKLNWAKDLFAELLDGFSLKKRDFEEKYGIPNEQLNFLASQGYISGFDQTTTWLRKHQDGLLPIDTDFEGFIRNGDWRNINKIQSLIDQILDKIKNESSEGRLQEAAPSVFKQMYPESLICTISGYVVPDPIGSNRLHTVRLRRPDTATHQPVLDEPTRPNLKGWESIGNTLYVSDRASQTGQRLDGWRLRPPHGEAGSFLEYLADNIERYYADSADEYIRIPDVVSFQHEDGHNDGRFNLQLHKLHSLYIIAYDIYSRSLEES